MSNFNSMLIDIVKNKKNCYIVGNNKIANDDVFEYMTSLSSEREYNTCNLFQEKSETTVSIANLLKQLEKDETKKSIVSINVDDFIIFSNVLKETSFETLEKQGFYVIDIHETAKYEDIYIRVYKLENNILKQLDIKGNC